MNALTISEGRDLSRLEGIIVSGLDTFVQVGAALLEIRERKLYRAAARTWEIYLKERWDISKSHGNRLIRASGLNKLVDNLAPIGAIANEYQARQVLQMESQSGDNGQSRQDKLKEILARIKRDEADNKAYRSLPADEKPWRDVAEARLKSAIKAWAGRLPGLERDLARAWDKAMAARAGLGAKAA